LKSSVEAIGVELEEIKRQSAFEMPGTDSNEEMNAISTAVEAYKKIERRTNALIDRIVYLLRSTNKSLNIAEYETSFGEIDSSYRDLVHSYKQVDTHAYTSGSSKAETIKLVLVDLIEAIKEIIRGGPKYRIDAAKQLENLKISPYFLIKRLALTAPSKGPQAVEAG
jgi:hypothetical protein